MDKVIGNLIKESIQSMDEQIEYLTKHKNKMEELLNKLDLSKTNKRCAICGMPKKDVDWLLELDPQIIFFNSGSNNLSDWVHRLCGRGPEYCSVCISYRIDHRPPKKSWDRDLNPPGEKTKVFRILDEHPQIEEIARGEPLVYKVRIGNIWYASQFNHMVW